MKSEEIDKNIQDLLLNASHKAGHFNTQLFDLGNGKFGYDIFLLCIDKKKSILLSGLYRDGVKRLLQELGVYNKKVHNGNIWIRKEKNIIAQISLKEIKDLVSQYLNQLPHLIVEISGIQADFSHDAQVETFYRQTNIVLNESFLDFLENDENEILKDEIDKSFLFFENGIFKITASGIVKLDYTELNDKVVWREKLINFSLPIKVEKVSHFEKFINNVSSNEMNRILSFKSAIGYLLHSYHKKSGGQMVMLYDEQITDLNNPQGGTGKGVIASAIKTIRNTVKLDGKKFKGNGIFDFQEVRLGTEVLWIDDVVKELNIDRFNSLTTDGFNVEAKFKGVCSLNCVKYFF